MHENNGTMASMQQPGAVLGLMTELPAIQQLRSRIEAVKASNPVRDRDTSACWHMNDDAFIVHHITLAYSTVNLHMRIV